MRQAVLWFPFVCVFFQSLGGCGGTPERGEGELPDYPGTLVSTERMGEDFLRRQKVTFLRGESESAMTAVVQKRGDELVLLGLTPFGSRAFLIRQRGVAFEVESFVPQPFPVPPKFVLLDVHRVHFMQAATDVRDGEVSIQRAGERIDEVWANGHLQTRTFHRNGYDAPIRVVFGASETDPVELENGWLHYRLRVETLEYRKLGSVSAD